MHPFALQHKPSWEYPVCRSVLFYEMRLTILVGSCSHKTSYEEMSTGYSFTFMPANPFKEYLEMRWRE